MSLNGQRQQCHSRWSAFGHSLVTAKSSTLVKQPIGMLWRRPGFC